MKGTISKIFHNERSSKMTVGETAYITNAKDRRSLSVGDVVDFEQGDFNGKPTANNVRKVGREEAPPAQSAAQEPATPKGNGGRAPWSKGKDDPDTAARIARSVALAEAIKLTSTLLSAGALPLPKDEKKQADAVVAFVKSTREEFYSYVAGAVVENAEAPPKGGESKVADLGQE
jgi:hypothetical protein